MNSLEISTRDDRVSNVRYETAVFLRDVVDADPEDQTGNVPAHVMRLAAAIQAIGRPGRAPVFEVVESCSSDGETSDASINVIGEIFLDAEGEILWKPQEVRITSQILDDDLRTPTEKFWAGAEGLPVEKS